MELYEEIRQTDSLLTFDPVDKIIYLRKKIVNENDPDDELGGYYVMKKLPRGKSFDKITAGSAEVRFIKKKVQQHSDFELTDFKKFNLLLEEALDTLQMKYLDWLDKADERREFEKQQQEQEAELEMEMIASEGYAIIDEMKHPLVCIAWMIDWCTAGERLNILYAFLAYSSQIILKNPISVIGIGDGGSGKTHIQEVALSMMPSEFVHTVKSTTDAALYGYCDDDPAFFDGKIVNIGDMGGKDNHEESQNFKNAMKEMQSDGHMRRDLREPDPVNGGWMNVTKELFGKPCLTYTNVPGFDFEDQEKSRSVFYQPRVDNDEAVATFKTLSRMKGTPTTARLEQEQSKIKDIKKMLIALRRRMDTTHIYNPYNDFMRKYLGSSRYFKRDVDKYDGILRVITAINGYRRPIINNTLFTTKEDIMFFMDILERYHESITSNLSPGASDLLQELRDNAENWSLYDDMEEGSGVTVNEYLTLTQNTRANKRSTGTHFSELNREGFVKAEKEGRSSRYYLLSSGNVMAKSDIELSEKDIKILKFNYDYDEVMDVLNMPISPLGIFSNPPIQPIWNDDLPENRR